MRISLNGDLCVLFQNDSLSTVVISTLKRGGKETFARYKFGVHFEGIVYFLVMKIILIIIRTIFLAQVFSVTFENWYPLKYEENVYHHTNHVFQC